MPILTVPLIRSLNQRSITKVVKGRRGQLRMS